MAEDYSGPDRRKCEPLRGGCAHADGVAETAADLAVAKVFSIFGVDVTKPDQVAEFQEDIRFGRKLRRIADHGTLALFGAFAVGLCAALWSGITGKMGVR